MYTQNFVRQALTIILLLPLLWIRGGSALAQTDSTWSTSPNSTDWFDPLNWNNGIPNAAGDSASVAGKTSTVTIDLNAQATLGHLRFLALGSIEIRGTGPLVFDQPGSDPASLRAVSDPQATLSAKITAPVSIAPGEHLLIDLATKKTLELHGSINSLGGNITKSGAGRLTLSSDNSTWTGSLTVEAGDLVLSDVNALASSSNLLIGPNSSLTFVPQDVTGQRDAHYVIPTVTLDGATIQTRQNVIRVAATQVDMNIHLSTDSSIALNASDLMHINGSIDGAGGLRFQKSTVPPVSGGSTGYPYVQINGPTSYSGETVIGPGMRVAFRQSAALGDASAGTLVDRGTLELYAGGGNEQIEVRKGRLALVGAPDPYGHQIILDEGQLYGGDDGGLAATLSTTVLYSGGVALGTEGGGDNLVLAAGIGGTGSVFSLNQVEVQGELSARGHFVATNRGPARLSGKLSLAGDVFVSDTQLELTGDLESPRGTFYLNPDFTVASLVARHSNTIQSVVIDPRSAERDTFHERFLLEAADAAVLTVSDELRFFGGTVRGAIAGQSLLAKKDRTPGVLEDIRGSEFTRVNVEGGQLTVRGDAGDSPPEIHLGTHDTSRLVIDDAGTYRGDIFLNNAQGNGPQAALAVSGNTTLAGNIYLGDRGSSLSTILSSGEVAEVTGIVHGGDFTVMGRQEIRLRSGNHAYNGKTHVLAENLRLVDEGRLNSTSMVVGNGRIGSGGGRAGLILDNSGVVVEDRIPDGTPVHLNGMKLTLIGRPGAQLTESLGTVHTARGISEIVVDNQASSQTTLRIETFSRQSGSGLRFDLGRNGGKVRFADAPTLDDNLIGGWAVVRGYGFSTDQDFATYGPDGVAAYRDLHTYATDLLAATSADNVNLQSQNTTLTSDKSINALRLGSDINLDAHTLTLESGGLLLLGFGDTISGGQLTAGTAEGAELFVSGIGSIEADIVDNAHGAIGLTYASDSGNLRLSGNNTYSGPTIFSAGTGNSVELLSSTALPAGTDLKVIGTDLRIAYSSTSPIVLGHVEVIDNALIRPSAGSPPALQMESMHIESGTISELNIIGDAPITKTGPGTALFGNTLATHSGPIAIEEGVLEAYQLGAALLDDEHAITVHSGATLWIQNDVVVADRNIRLDGGIFNMELRGGVSAPLEILAGGGIIRNQRGTTVVTSPITGQGPLLVEGGLGNGVISFEADLNAFDGPLRFTGGTTNVRGSNGNYSQAIEIAGSNVSATGTNVFGTGEVTILPEGHLNIIDSMTGDLVLAGGALAISPSNVFASATLRGDLRVTENSYLLISPLFDPRRTSPIIDSALSLFDQTTLNVSPDIAYQPDSVAANVYFHHVQEQITFSGDIIVNGEASMTSYDAVVWITGTIRPGAEHSMLNLIGNDTFNFRGSIQLEESKSLAVTIDGELAPLELTGASNSLAGNGTYVGDIEVSHGASIAPGQSPGKITIVGETTIGEGAQYDWQIESVDGTPGEAWDLLQVEGDLHFTATSVAPWTLRISDLPGFQPGRAQRWLIASAISITGFDATAVRFDISGISDVWPSLTPNQLVLYTQDEDLFLQVVPEPASLILTAAGIVMAAALRRRKDW